ncbi:hypothetical protein KBD08_03015 [Candidatus Babeliales bacterium]|nr:hypothetical protein [Candidatus Babeliales bacterium]
MKQKLLLLVLAIGYVQTVSAASAAGVGQPEKIKVLSWNVMGTEMPRYFIDRDVYKIRQKNTVPQLKEFYAERVKFNVGYALTLGCRRDIDFICFQQVSPSLVQEVIDQHKYEQYKCIYVVMERASIAVCMCYNSNKYQRENGPVMNLSQENIARIGFFDFFTNLKTRQQFCVGNIAMDFDTALKVPASNKRDLLKNILYSFLDDVPTLVVGSFNVLNPFCQQAVHSLYDDYLKMPDNERKFEFPKNLQNQYSFCYLREANKSDVECRYNDYAFYFGLNVLQDNFQDWGSRTIGVGSYYQPMYLEFALPQIQASRSWEQAVGKDFRQGARDVERDVRKFGRALESEFFDSSRLPSKAPAGARVTLEDVAQRTGQTTRELIELEKAAEERAIQESLRSIPPQATTRAAEFGRARREYTGLEEVRPGILQQVSTSSHHDPYAEHAPSPRRSMPVSFQPQARQPLHALDVEKLLRLLKEVDRLKRGRR